MEEMMKFFEKKASERREKSSGNYFKGSPVLSSERTQKFSSKFRQNCTSKKRAFFNSFICLEKNLF